MTRRDRDAHTVRRTRTSSIVALALASFVLSLVAGEMVLRWNVPEWSVIIPPTNFRPDLFEAAPFGYRLKPGTRGEYRYSSQAAATRIEANGDGFRSARSFSGDADARPRIVVVGDSMVFGLGVEEGARFTEVLEAQHPGWRVENLGMVGFGPDLMLRAFEAVGLALHPAVVVVVVHSDDLRRVSSSYTGMGFALPKYELNDGELTSQPYPEPKPWERLLLYQGARFAYWRYSETSFALNAAIFDRFLALATRHQFALVLAYVPPPRPSWHDRMRQEFLAGWARGNRVEYVDLSPPDGMTDVYLPADSHWSVAGHSMVAAKLAPALDSAPPPLPR